jgi:hypothetical protein
MSITHEQAIALCKSGWWKDKTAQEVVRFQLFTDLLCMPFSDYHEAIEKALGRPVWTHEFAWPENLRAEFLKDKPAPTLDEIFGLIPEEKRIILVIGGQP